MVNACDAVGVKVIVDVVTNHMAGMFLWSFPSSFRDLYAEDETCLRSGY